MKLKEHWHKKSNVRIIRVRTLRKFKRMSTLTLLKADSQRIEYQVSAVLDLNRMSCPKHGSRPSRASFKNVADFEAMLIDNKYDCFFFDQQTFGDTLWRRLIRLRLVGWWCRSYLDELIQPHLPHGCEWIWVALGHKSKCVIWYRVAKLYGNTGFQAKFSMKIIHPIKVFTPNVVEKLCSTHSRQI